jgi:hypothetical protein
MRLGSGGRFCCLSTSGLSPQGCRGDSGNWARCGACLCCSASFWPSPGLGPRPIASSFPLRRLALAPPCWGRRAWPVLGPPCSGRRAWPVLGPACLGRPRWPVLAPPCWGRRAWPVLGPPCSGRPRWLALAPPCWGRRAWPSVPVAGWPGRVWSVLRRRCLWGRAWLPVLHRRLGGRLPRRTSCGLLIRRRSPGSRATAELTLPRRPCRRSTPPVPGRSSMRADWPIAGWSAWRTRAVCALPMSP